MQVVTGSIPGCAVQKHSVFASASQLGIHEGVMIKTIRPSCMDRTPSEPSQARLVHQLRLLGETPQITGRGTESPTGPSRWYAVHISGVTDESGCRWTAVSVCLRFHGRVECARQPLYNPKSEKGGRESALFSLHVVFPHATTGSLLP